VEGFGAITNTRALEDSVVEALERLEQMPSDGRTQALRTKAAHYRDILASWELMPPSDAEQSETVSSVLQLLGKVMAYVNGEEPPALESDPLGVAMPDLEDFGQIDDLPPLGLPSLDEPGERPKRGLPARGGTALTADRPAPQRKRNQMPRRQVHSKRKVSVGRIELQVASGQDRVETADVIFPFQRPWEPLARVEGGSAKPLDGDLASGEHVLVRLLDGARLQSHVQATPEVIYVLRGGIRLAEETLFAGAVIRTTANAHCPTIRSIGETELLFIGSVRPELATS